MLLLLLLIDAPQNKQGHILFLCFKSQNQKKIFTLMSLHSKEMSLGTAAAAAAAAAHDESRCIMIYYIKEGGDEKETK